MQILAFNFIYSMFDVKKLLFPIFLFRIIFVDLTKLTSNAICQNKPLENTCYWEFNIRPHGLTTINVENKNKRKL